jgi:uncharacterized C2H2 Zn-finger protein
MTLIQKFVLNVLPKRWSAAIQAESESWLLRCPACGHVQSVWQLGGVRFKAASVGKRVGVICLQCHTFQMMPMERKQL